VARVIALRARAECYVKADENYPAAIEALEEALALEDVDWALPGVALSLGDAYRLDGQAHKALEAYRKVFDVGNASRGERAVAHLNMGLTYQYTLRDHAKAREAYRVAGDLNPDLKSEIEGHLDRME
jgi:tetratricopeptide (TPR) repeat protein